MAPPPRRSVLLLVVACAACAAASAGMPLRGGLDTDALGTPGAGADDIHWADYDGDGIVDWYAVESHDGQLIAEDLDGNGVEDCFHLVRAGKVVTFYDIDEDGVPDSADTDGNGETDAFNVTGSGSMMPRAKRAEFSSRDLGIAFSYPGTWRDGEPLEKGKIVVLPGSAQVSLKVTSVPAHVDAAAFAAELAKRIGAADFGFAVERDLGARRIGGNIAAVHLYRQPTLSGRSEGWYFVFPEGTAVWAKVQYIDTPSRAEVMSVLASLRSLTARTGPPTPAVETGPAPAAAQTAAPDGWHSTSIPEQGLDLFWPADWAYTRAQPTAHVLWKKDFGLVQVFYKKVAPGTSTRDFSDAVRAEMNGFTFLMDLGTTGLSGYTAHACAYKHDASGRRYTMYNTVAPSGNGMTIGMILLDENAEEQTRAVVERLRIR